MYCLKILCFFQDGFALEWSCADFAGDDVIYSSDERSNSIANANAFGYFPCGRHIAVVNTASN